MGRLSESAVILVAVSTRVLSETLHRLDHPKSAQNGSEMQKRAYNTEMVRDTAKVFVFPMLEVLSMKCFEPRSCSICYDASAE